MAAGTTGAAAGGGETAKKIAYGQYTVPPASEMINFSVGQPAPSLLPLERIRDASAKKFAEEDPLFLQYGQMAGYPEFLESLSKFLGGHYGKEVDPKSLFVTNGVTGSLGLFASLFLRTGDTVVVEEPSYFLALSIFADFGVKTESVPIHKDGIDVDALEARLKDGFRPAALYTVPVYHNPTGYTMSVEKREKLAALAHEYEFFILADEVYQLLGYRADAPPPPPMVYFDKGSERIVSIGSFSKILAPALRIGWFQTGKRVIDKLCASGQLDSSGGITPVISGIVHKCLTEGHQEAHLAAVREELGGRAKTLAAALHKHLPEGCSFEEPEGGYFLWIRVPDSVDGGLLADHAFLNHKVRFLPGVRFGESLRQYIRLSFSYYGADDMALGAERLGEAIRTYIANGGPVGDVAGKAAAAGSR